MNKDEEGYYGLAPNSIPNSHPFSKGITSQSINLKILVDILKSWENQTK